MPSELAGTDAPPAVASVLTADSLAEQHAPVVYRFCAMVCRDAHDADDLAQEALLRAMPRGRRSAGDAAPSW
jgi:DNA-directed RNA polymerase specialized sigma24 family protein